MPTRDEVVVGQVEEFPIGKFRVLEVSGREVGILRDDEGRLRAIRNSCPHRGAPICDGLTDGTMMPSPPGELAFGLEGQIIRCPRHAYEFSLETGECLFTDYVKRITVYPVRVKRGVVHLGLRPVGAPPARIRRVGASAPGEAKDS
jgi:nitrite reductase (NADH) small subunit